MTALTTARRLAGTGGLAEGLRRRGVYVALVLLVLVNLVLTDHFAGSVAVTTILAQAAPVVLISLGMALAIGTRGVDLSVGSVMAFGSAVVALYLGYGAVPAVVAALVLTGVLGLVNGALVAFLEINPLIASLGLLVGVRGLAEVLTGGFTTPLPQPLFTFLGHGTVGPVPVAAVVAGAVAVVIGVVVARTTFGRHIVFIGGNRAASAICGVPIRRTLLAVYALSGVLAGLAGVLASTRIEVTDPANIGLNYELDAVAAVVVGGTPLSGGRVTVAGTVAGALLLQVLDATFVMNDIRYTYAQILKAAIIVLAVFLQRRRESPA